MPQDDEFTKIHQILLERYSLEELRTLSIQLSVSIDDLPGEGRPSKARELILWLRRRGRLHELIRLLESQTTLIAQAQTKVDLAIVTAMPEELEPVLQLIGGRKHWQQFLLDKFVHYKAQFDFEGYSFNVVASSLWEYGGTPTATAILRLKQLQPKLIIMTGICAGWESKGIHFGDVIIAERAFHANRGRQTSDGFEPDIRTYQPPPWLLNWLGDFSSNTEWFNSIQTPRPRSLRYQAEWLLCQIAEHGPSFPKTDADRRKLKTNQINYQRVRKFLVEKALINESGILTELAASRLNDLRQQNHGKLAPIRDPKQPKAHYGAFASTDAVIAIENPFLEYAQRIRKVRAIELEVASLFAAASEIEVPAFAVKGVSDYGTPDKDDEFHSYAAEASARWMYKFLQTYGHLLIKIKQSGNIF